MNVVNDRSRRFDRHCCRRLLSFVNVVDRYGSSMIIVVVRHDRHPASLIANVANVANDTPNIS